MKLINSPVEKKCPFYQSTLLSVAMISEDSRTELTLPLKSSLSYELAARANSLSPRLGNRSSIHHQRQ